MRHSHTSHVQDPEWKQTELSELLHPCFLLCTLHAVLVPVHYLAPGRRSGAPARLLEDVSELASFRAVSQSFFYLHLKLAVNFGCHVLERTVVAPPPILSLEPRSSTNEKVTRVSAWREKQDGNRLSVSFGVACSSAGDAPPGVTCAPDVDRAGRASRLVLREARLVPAVPHLHRPHKMTTSASTWIEGPEKLSFYTKTWTPSEATGVKASVMFHHGCVRLPFAPEAGRWTSVPRVHWARVRQQTGQEGHVRAARRRSC